MQRNLVVGRNFYLPADLASANTDENKIAVTGTGWNGTLITVRNGSRSLYLNAFQSRQSPAGSNEVQLSASALHYLGVVPRKTQVEVTPASSLDQPVIASKVVIAFLVGGSLHGADAAVRRHFSKRKVIGCLVFVGGFVGVWWEKVHWLDECLQRRR